MSSKTPISNQDERKTAATGQEPPDHFYFPYVLNAEREEIQKRRDRVYLPTEVDRAQNNGGQTAGADPKSRQPLDNLVGLALSGAGSGAPLSASGCCKG